MFHFTFSNVFGNTGLISSNQPMNLGGSNAFAMHMMINQLKMSESSNETKSLLNHSQQVAGTKSAITSNSLASIKCSQHITETCSSYCQFCCQLICNECGVSVQHRSHMKTSLVEAVNEAKRSTENLLNESAQIIDVFKDSLKQSLHTIGKIQAKADTVVTEITKSHQSHMAALDQRKQLLLANADLIKTTKINSLNKQISEIKARFSTIDDLVRDISAKIGSLPDQTENAVYGEQHVQLIFESKQRLVAEISALRSFHTNNYHELLPLFQVNIYIYSF